MRSTSLVILAVVLAMAAPARAQWTNPTTGRTFNNPISSSIDLYIQQSMERKMLARMLERKRAGKAATAAEPGAKPAKVKHAPVSASDFKRGKGRPTVDAFLTANNLDPTAEKQLRVVIDATFTALEKELRPNSVASAMGFVLAASVQIANDVEIPDAEARELVTGVNDLLAASPAFRKLKAADRQALYDGFVMAGALLMILKAAGDNDPAMKTQAQDMAKGIVAQLSGVGATAPAAP